MTDVSGNVQAISTYTIGTGCTVTLAVYNILAAIASDQVTSDDPNSTLSTDESNRAQALYVCHLIAQRQGLVGKVSESIGKYSYSKKLASGLTTWLDAYHEYMDTILSGGKITAEDLLGDSGAGYDHYDVEQSKVFRLDQEPDQGQVTEDTESTDSYFYGGA